MKLSFKNILLEKTHADRRENKIGRYSVSGIWAINNNYMSMKKFIDGEDFDFVSCFRMWNGTWKHAQLEDLFKWKGYQVEQKREKEIVHDDAKFTIVGKADIFDLIETEDVCDFKTSDTLTSEAKPWSMYQVKMYCTLFEKPVGYIVEPRKNANDIWLEVIGKVERNDEWFEYEMCLLKDFHKKLLKKYGDKISKQNNRGDKKQNFSQIH